MSMYFRFSCANATKSFTSCPSLTSHTVPCKERLQFRTKSMKFQLKARDRSHKTGQEETGKDKQRRKKMN